MARARVLASLDLRSAEMLGGIERALARYAAMPGCIVAIEKTLLAASWPRCLDVLGSDRLGAWVLNEPVDLERWMAMPLRQVTTDRQTSRWPHAIICDAHLRRRHERRDARQTGRSEAAPPAARGACRWRMGASVRPDSRSARLPDRSVHTRRRVGLSRPDGVVLWTRLAPDPLQVDALDPVPVRVDWEVAEDAAFRRNVARGSEMAIPEAAHSVHVEVEGLRPGRDYWYRFRAGEATSPVGRTRTAPAPAKAARPSLRLRLLPAIRAGLLRGVPRHGGAANSTGRPPRRLYL